MATLKNLVDETTNIKNELKTCHTNLSNNLISKGVEVSSDDKLPSLIDKVDNIIVGKRWASGSFNSDFNTEGNDTYTKRVSTSLDFTPSFVFVNFNYLRQPSQSVMRNTVISNKFTTTLVFNSSGTSYKANFIVQNISSSGFDIYIDPQTSGSTYMVISSNAVTWYAFE